MRVPEIVCFTYEDGHRATFGLALSSIQPCSVAADPNVELDFVQIWRTAHQNNVRLLHAFSRWPHPLSVELHIVSFPSLNNEVRGRNEITLRFHVTADSQDRAVELALADSIKLEVLLETLWPRARYVPLDPTRLKQYKPFAPQACLMVGRRSQSISPANPLSLHRSPIGFKATNGPHREDNYAPSESNLVHIYPWIPSIGEDLSTVLDALLLLPTPRWIVMRIGTDSRDRRSHALERLGNATELCERYLCGLEPEQVTLTAQAHAIRDASLDRYAQLSDASLCGAMLVFSPGAADLVTASLVGQSVTGDHGRRQTGNLLEGGFSIREVCPADAMDCLGHFEGEPFTAEEAACAFRLPLITGHRDLGLHVQRHRTAEFQMQLTADESLDSIQLGVNIHNDRSRPICIDTLDRLRHTLIIGATGSGKSTILLSMALQDARSGRGFSLIDPHGDLADQFLARFPRHRADDLIIVDFDDRESPVPLNLLTWKTPQERDLLIDTLYSTLLATYNNPDYFGPVFESHFRSALRLLLGDKPREDFVPTLLELPQVFRNPTFRSYLLSQSADEDVNSAIREANRVSSGDHRLENIAPYITSKFARFLQDSQLRRIVGHGKMALDFRAMMDSSKIIVFKLAQGRLGRHISDILFAQIVARFRLAAMGRGDIPPDQRRPFFLYCDEFQVIADENFADMLSTSRKWALGLICTNQFATQLQAHGVLDSALANVGTLISFRVGIKDAQLLAPMFRPTVGISDLVECPNWKGYMRLFRQERLVRPFSFQNLPDPAAADELWAKELYEVSRKKWGVSSDETELMILERDLFIKGLPETAARSNGD